MKTLSSNNALNMIVTKNFLTAFTSLALLTCFAPENATAKTINSYPKVSLTKGMSYSAARMSLLKAGWRTPILPSGGYQPSDEKVVSECSGNTDLCNALPEIEACSGTGLGTCRLTFNYRHRYELSVFTVGDIDLWKNTRVSKEGYPAISGWKIKRILVKK